MIHISPDNPSFTLIGRREMASEADQQRVLEAIERRTADSMRHQPGFVSHVIYRGLRNKFVGEYLQWQSREHWHHFRSNQDVDAHANLPNGTLARHVAAYQLLRTVSATGIQTVSDQRPQPLMMWLWFTPLAHTTARAVADFNIAETERVIQHLPGFVGVSFFLGEDGTYVEHAHWTSAEAFMQQFQTAYFQQHIREAEAMAHTTLDLFEVHRLFTAQAAGGGGDGNSAASIGTSVSLN